MTVYVNIDASDVRERLDAFGRDVRAALGAYAVRAAADMEQYAKENRPWTDRTGNARRTLEGVFSSSSSPSPSPSGDSITVGVEGHMPYSPILELGYGGRFAILAPTVRHFAPDLLLGFADLVAS